MGDYVYVCVWVSFLWPHCLQLISNASTLFDCCRFSVRFEVVDDRPFSFLLFVVLFFSKLALAVWDPCNYIRILAGVHYFSSKRQLI